MVDSIAVNTGADTIEGDLLPPNATVLERQLSNIASSISQLPVDTRRLWDASRCTEPFLPWLAWAMSVEHWQDDWHENVKRSLLKQSITVHKQRGTRAAVRAALRLVLALADDRNRTNISGIEAYDNSFLIHEWWEQRGENALDAKMGVVEASASDTKGLKTKSPDTKPTQEGLQKTSPRSQPLTFDIQLLIGGGVLGGRGLLRPELYRDLRRAIDAVKPMSTRYTLSIGGAKLETELPVRSGVRAIRIVSFMVSPKIALKFESKLPMASVARAVEAQFLKLSAVHKLKLQRELPLQHGLRAIEKQNLVFRLPMLKLEKTTKINASIRALKLLRLKTKMDSVS